MRVAAVRIAASPDAPMCARTHFAHSLTYTKHFGCFESSSDCELLPFQRCRNNEYKDILVCLVLLSMALPSTWMSFTIDIVADIITRQRMRVSEALEMAGVRFIWQIKSHSIVAAIESNE